MTEEEFILYNNLLSKAIEKAKKNGFSKETGVCYYNLAACLRDSGKQNMLKAFSYYRMAVKYDPTYKNRDYFWSEIAGILFLLEKYNYSEKFYNRAFQTKPIPEYLALRADAIMFAGRYKEAYSLFNKYIEIIDKPEDEWILKSVALSFLLSELKLKQQKRYPYEAMNLVEVITGSVEEDEKKIEHALTLDALSGLLWFNRGVLKASKKDFHNAFNSFLIAGLVQPNDVEAWSNVIICLFNYPEQRKLLPYILSFAYWQNNENVFRKFVETIEKQSEKNLPKSYKTDLINTMSQIFHSLPKKEKPKTIRYINSNGTYNIVNKDDFNS
jgi:tetratricopeptide (TPR) repeat protein